ncbi:MAG: type I restriction endonuclease subunit R, partial [Candidatus Aminicenantes bacterium]
LSELVRDLKDAQEQRQKSKLSPEAFAVAWWLRVQKGFEVEQAERLAASVEPAFKKFPHWALIEAHERELRKQLYRELIASGVKDVVAWVDEMLTLLRRAAP